ncbi:MAG TPA: hypothetical protein VKV39_09185 [Candidatus Sulfotelmatobacter sp.]|nr:hypothetical protein [Candidatus Sulfotelmatobacter sp.]
MDALSWLLDSDPAISWQALRDLTDASPDVISATRRRVPREGLGAQILASQQSDGSWRRPDSPAWLSTLFTLLLLRATGIDPTEPAVQAAAARLEAGVRWNDQGGCWELRAVETGGNTFFEGEVEPCINGGALAVGAFLGRPNDSLARRLLTEQLEDGGWNCDAPKSKRSSFHTTICVLEGLLQFECAAGSPPEITTARKRGEEYLLERGLYRRLSTGKVANPEFLELAFPPRYHYDILRALDYFRNAGSHDPRMNDALQTIRNRRQPDGRWVLDCAYEEAVALPTGESVGQPSRWNTLRALGVLQWSEKRQG